MATTLRASLPATRRRARALALIRALSIQDYAIGTYLALLLLAVLAGSGPNPDRAELLVGVDMVVYAVGILVTRGRLLPRKSLLGVLLYRVLGPAIVFVSYLQLRVVLPAVTTESYDLQLYALDLRLFGVEPAVAWDRFVTPARTEWLAAFYFSFFPLVAAFAGSMVLFARDRIRLAAFALGILLVFGLGQLLYTVVPGFGPYRALADRFEHPLEGALFWPLVQSTVAAGGAMKDIFPSLHTAVTVFLGLFAFRHRRAGAGYRIAWPVIAVIASQIMIATMYLRWHYLIDVIAGLILALAVERISARAAVWETAHRGRIGAPPVFEVPQLRA